LYPSTAVAAAGIYGMSFFSKLHSISIAVDLLGRDMEYKEGKA
jgi:hypothetical protein